MVSLVSIIEHRLDQNLIRNLLYRFEIMFCGSPKLTQTCSKKILEVVSIVILFLHGVKMAILEN